MRVPCISVKQKGEIFFLAKFKAEELREYVTFHFRDPYFDLNNEPIKVDKYIQQLERKGIDVKQDSRGTQRRIKSGKIKKIKEYISKNEFNFFPNTVVLSVDISKYDNFEEEYYKIIRDDVGIINIPKDTNISIIDGQHRLAGIFTSDEYIMKSIEIPAVVLFNVSVSTAARLFLDINANQSPVNKSLIYDLYGEIEDKDVQILKEYNIICQKLYKDIKSPLYRQIKMLGVGSGSISQSFFIDTVKTAIDKTDLKDKDIQEKYNHIFMYLKAFQKTFKEDWPVPDVNTTKSLSLDMLDKYADNVLKNRKSQLAKTNGFGAIYQVFPKIYEKSDKDYNNYYDIIKTLKNEIDWTKVEGTGKSAQKKLANQIESMIFKENVSSKGLLYKGKEKGYLTLEEIMEAFSETELDRQQVENLYETLGILGIEVRNKI